MNITSLQVLRIFQSIKNAYEKRSTTNCFFERWEMNTANERHKMQETRNNCLGSKKCNTAKTYGTCAYLFSSNEESC